MLKDQEILTENTQFVDNKKDNLHKKENKEKMTINKVIQNRPDVEFKFLRKIIN